VQGFFGNKEPDECKKQFEQELEADGNKDVHCPGFLTFLQSGEKNHQNHNRYECKGENQYGKVAQGKNHSRQLSQEDIRQQTAASISSSLKNHFLKSFKIQGYFFMKSLREV
jgi:hypothetical protein